MLAALTLVVYWQAAGFELTNYDDDVYVTDNPYLAPPLTWQSVRWACTAFYQANWHPLTWISLMVDRGRGGGSPGAYHATNVVLHVLNVVLLYLVLCAATKSVWRSALVAALFAVHPLHVESVAWVAERKDVLSTFFLLLTLLAYVLSARRLTLPKHLLIAVLFAAGLCSKPMLVSLPILLLLIDYWPLQRERGTGNSEHKGQGDSLIALVVEKAPLFVLAGASCVVTFLAQRSSGTVRPLEAYSLGVRLANAVVVCVSYLGKMVWPVGLAPFYPHPGRTLPVWQVAGSLVLLAAITFAVVRYRRQAPQAFVGWFWYVVTLLPVIGIVQVGDQAMADRYTYVPLLGIFVAIAWSIPAVARAGRRDSVALKARDCVVAGLAGCVIVILAVACYRQVGLWRSSTTLFSHAVRIDPRNYLAYNNLGAAVLDDAVSDPRNINLPMLNKAVGLLQRSLEIKQGYVEALYNLGTALARAGRTDEAARILQRALESRPDAPRVHNNLGIICLSQEHYSEAEKHFRAAVRSNPNLQQAYSNLALALYKQGRFGEAADAATAALRIQPDFAQAHVVLGNALLTLEKYSEAARHYERAIDLDPGGVTARANLAAAYERLGRVDAALDQLRTALSYQPNNPVLRSRYESLLASSGAR